jgi:hypothetical protein
MPVSVVPANNKPDYLSIVMIQVKQMPLVATEPRSLFQPAQTVSVKAKDTFDLGQ